jgi:hypothetical protein
VFVLVVNRRELGKDKGKRIRDKQGDVIVHENRVDVIGECRGK